MKKKNFQWLSALALMVMSALVFVACGDDDNGGAMPDNSKIIGSWVITEVSPSTGPDVGEEMTFNKDGSFIVGKDKGSYTYDSETGTFTAKMGDMTMVGNFTVNGDVVTGSANVTVDGKTQLFTMKMNRKGTEPEVPTVSCTKMVGTWKVITDKGDNLKDKTATFDEQGNCTIGGEECTYTCEEGENGSFDFKVFNKGGEAVAQGTLVLVNGGKVLNGQYKTSGTDTYALVMKNPEYTYPTEGIYGRWQFTYVAQAAGGYDEFFAERLPMANKEEVFVIDEDGKLYLEGEAAVGNYTWNGTNNNLRLFFAGKYGELVYSVGGLITFSDEDKTMTIPQGRGTFAINQGSSMGFQGTISRVK